MQTGLNSPVAALTALLLVAGSAAAATPPSDPPPTDSPAEATVRISNPQPRAEEPFFVEVELRWTGGADRLLPHPPRFELPESWEAGALAASTRMDDGWSVVLYRLELTAFEPGSFRPEPVHVHWASDDATLPTDLRVEIPEVTVSARPLGLGSPASPPLQASRPAAGVPTSTPPIGTAILALLLAVGALLLRRIRSRVRIFSTEGSNHRNEHAQAHRLARRLARQEELLRQAARLRQDGHPTEAVHLLGEILQELDAQGPLTARRLEEIRYGGNPPRSEELEGLEARVRRELEARAPRTPADGTPQRRGIQVPSAVQSMD